MQARLDPIYLFPKLRLKSYQNSKFKGWNHLHFSVYNLYTKS
jgi:hypothetical protein